ncbi:ribose-5-phosphate isomerase RpiA [Candidatus Neomarinimicrobiota bacterium]
MEVEEKKQMAAKAALVYIKPEMVIGIGTGSTANLFIDSLADAGINVGLTVASSNASAERLQRHGIRVQNLETIERVSVYIDGADEANHRLELIKGGGGALTREKILATASHTFICMIHDSKMVERLGTFPLPVEVIPSARTLVTKALMDMGGNPVEREGFSTDNGNLILDVHDLNIENPVELETDLNQIPGVVCNGLFAHRRADILLVGTDNGVQTLS